MLVNAADLRAKKTQVYCPAVAVGDLSARGMRPSVALEGEGLSNFEVFNLE